MTYAQIIQKKKEKEAKEAAERAAKEAEENHSEQSGKGKRILNPTETLMKVNGYFIQEKLRINPVLCPLLPSQIQPHLLLRLRQRPHEPPAAAPAAGAQPAPAPAHAPVERQDSRQGGKHGGGHARLAKTNSSGGQTGDRDRPGDNKGRPEPVRQGPGGQQRPHKRTEGPKSPVTGGK